MFENIALAFRGIWNHKLRSFLTMLGIIIGIASIITIVSTIKGTNEQIKQNLVGSGSNVVTVELESENGWLDYDYGEMPSGVLCAGENERDALDAIDGVKEASLYYTREWANRVYAGDSAFNGQVFGIDGHYFPVNGYRIVYGRGFTEDDHASRRKVCIIDTAAMQNVFEGKNPVGKTLEMQNEPFVIIGVAEKTEKTEVTINSVNDYWMYGQTETGKLFIPMECWSIVYRYDEPLRAAVRAESTDDMTKAGNDAAQSLNDACVFNEKYKYKAANLLEQAAELQALTNATNSQLIWIAGISLLVGGIGVMNIMLVSVTERTREIGLKKALGARRRRILRQFLTEASVLTSLGGLLGVLAGIGLAKMLSSVMSTATAVSVPACVIAVVFSMVIGIVFGLIPAMKASKLNPIDALRRE